MEYYPAKRREDILPFATRWMELKSIMRSETRQRPVPYDLTYTWNLKEETNSQKQRVDWWLPGWWSGGCG